MMENTELIKALKDAEMYMIYIAPNCYASCEAIKAIRAAADALEADERLLDQNTERCEALRKQLRESNENYEKHLNELEAQMPKEGEWIMDGKYNRHCSRCNEDVVWSFNYCPNCGARMRTVTDCHTLEEGER